MAKGDVFERDNCRYLSKWWSNDERDDIFWRNRVRITSKTPNAERQLGDIIAVRSEGIPLTEFLNIEFKRGYSKTRAGKRYRNVPWDALDIIDSKLKEVQIIVFWEQTVSDAAMSGRHPFLIFQRDFHNPCVCISRSLDAKFSRYQKELRSAPCLYMRCPAEPFELKIYARNTFFALVRPRHIEQMQSETPATFGGFLRSVEEGKSKWKDLRLLRTSS